MAGGWAHGPKGVAAKDWRHASLPGRTIQMRRNAHHLAAITTFMVWPRRLGVKEVRAGY